MRNKGLSFYKKKKKISQALLREIFSWIFSIALSVFLARVIVIFLGRSARVVGMSMEPTLENGQQIYIDRFTYILSSPKAGDVVAFLPNGNENSHYYIKRVVAGPGDKVRIADGTLYVNGQQSIWVTERVLDAGIAENELILGSGEYFCIGDNPNNSEDSRSANIGPVDEDDIVGKAWFHLKSSTEGMGFIKYRNAAIKERGNE